MALELKQQVKLTQQLVMTPQLQQAIKLLQLSRMELVGVVQHELEENAVLEEVVEGDEERGEESSDAAIEGAEADAGEPSEIAAGSDAVAEIDAAAPEVGPAEGVEEGGEAVEAGA